jgi:hypothetical protein
MSKFSKFTTISGREIYVRPNYSKRHFTIKTDGGKFRTHRMTAEEFDSNEHNTGNDWQSFLNSDDYYSIK